MASVTLEKLCKIYDGDFYANNNIDLKIHDGEFITLVGPSGCGKTTSLRMIAGLLMPTSGRIFFDDEDVTHMKPQKRQIGMVFQDYALFPHLKVRDNIAFGLKIQKYPKSEIQHRVMEGVKLVNLGGYEHRRLSELSGGQRQRVALARALVMEPRVFLMDEPLSNLDAKLRLHMRTELKRIHKKIPVTTIYVTHDQVEAMTLSSRVVIMKAGIIQQVGTPDEVYNQPANQFVGGFIGSPPMNFLENADLREKDGQLKIFAKGITISVPQRFKKAIEEQNLKKVTVGIRPEHLSLTQRDEPATGKKDDILQMMVDVIEPIGADMFLDLYHNDLHLKAKVDADSSVQTDDQITIEVDLPKIHLFDPDTQVVLPMDT